MAGHMRVKSIGNARRSASITPSAKVAPETLPPGAVQLHREALRAQAVQFLDHPYVSSFLTACTIFALFGDDVRAGFLSKSADLPCYNALFACFIFFLLELGIAVYARPNYFQRGTGFNFYLDLIATFSILPDVEWIWSPLLGGDSSSSVRTTALKAGRASRAGTKAGRIVRLIRVIRVIRVLRSKRDDVQDQGAISEPSKIGKVLTERTTRRLIVLVLLIILVSPIIDGTVDLLSNDFQVNELERLHRFPQDYNISGQISTQHFREMVMQYVRDSSGLILNMNIQNWNQSVIAEWLMETRFQPLLDGDWDHHEPYTLDVNPKTKWSAQQYLTWTPAAKLRSSNFQILENFGCFHDGICTDCEGHSACHSYVTYDIHFSQQKSARMSLAKTIVVMFCFGISILVLTKDAEVMVIGPIERMMRLVTQLAENPLGATENHEKADGGHDYETRMLEETLGKIGRLLQVGFGAAGTEIIAKNMGGAGALDVMIPGKKITSVFGFGIIEHFTETCSLLEEDIITYINTIAEIVHGNAKNFHGAANKNIGAAFLLAWKICDGSLPGVRDPRDTEKTIMSTEEKAHRRQNIAVRSAGQGSVMRSVTPTEMVDSALTAVLSMRIDIHHANTHGTLEKFCRNPKLTAAFGDFEVHLGFGLHIGWAIEGAIGSRYKIDASYLSPNVNMAARLEAATGQFDVPMLLSEWFVEELSPEARQFCRKIDRVAVKGSEIPMDLWTFDIGTYPSTGIPAIIVEGEQKPVAFAHDSVYQTLQEAIPREFFASFEQGITAYFDGRWQIAKDKLHRANEMWEDGPTKVDGTVFDN
uniref:Voltagegated Ion Channel (VIC) Superfamily putative n=1 Tax=Albugo laibachii Nc14 TaxID=890382 RepID=F0W8Y5_9STRA|nr:Voltagegated Ion Channel (VIC) Superfamily putative [Albugo laibachii Nc14]|eukprot:CCA17596.1 Voltagegated Ion Channel (VIC) Superfamily putative [Albugo laibachii Nc14]